MRVSRILNLFPQHKKITLRGKYDKVPGLYLIVFDRKTGYVGHSRSIGRRVKDFWYGSPLLRYLGVNPHKYPIYFLCEIKDGKRRKQTERRIIRKFSRCLNNIEYANEPKKGKKLG